MIRRIWPVLLLAVSAQAIPLAHDLPQTKPDLGPVLAIDTVHLGDPKPEKPKKLKHPHHFHGRGEGHEHHPQDLVPEPSSLLLLGFGLLGLGLLGRRIR